MVTKPYHFYHISDLHFGRVNDQVLRDLKSCLLLNESELDLVILTGDLTQRARTHQFLNAKEFISQFKVPFFVVPGNHDVPLYNLFKRFFNPYAKYKRTMQNLAIDYYEDEFVAVFGLWTVDRFKVQEGRLSFSQIQKLEKKFPLVPAGKLKVIACHHPLESMQDEGVRRLVALKPDLVLWGHDHQSLARYFHVDEKSLPLLLASGTSISTRTRAEANSFNSVKIYPDRIEVRVLTHSSEDGEFTLSAEKTFDLKSRIVPLQMQSPVGAL